MKASPKNTPASRFSSLRSAYRLGLVSGRGAIQAALDLQDAVADVPSECRRAAVRYCRRLTSVRSRALRGFQALVPASTE